MLTLDSTTLFFYSRIISNNDQGPPLKKPRHGKSISSCVGDIKSNAPPPSRAASSRPGTSSRAPPTLTAGSTRSSSNSVLTKNIRVTQNNTVAATNVKKEHAYIKVEDGGIISDYDEMHSQERYKALASPFKNGVRATSSVSRNSLLLRKFGFTIIHQNVVTENRSKSVAPKGSKPFKRSDLPDGLNYEVLRRTVIPTVIAYYSRQKDPWDRPQSILCNEIRVILRSVSGMDFNIDPKEPIYKNVRIINHCRHYPHSFIFSGYSTSFGQLASRHWLGLINSYHNLHL
jgi:hypothetical protein